MASDKYAMLISKPIALLLFLWLLMPFVSSAAQISEYNFPIKNPFFATIATSPPEYRPKLINDSDIDQKLITIKGLRKKLPNNLWDVKDLKVPVAYQNNPAPLIFIIAGTGASYKSQKMQFLKKILYQAGFHVVLLSSPTNYDFIASSSRKVTPGLSRVDADDLYQVMQQVIGVIAKDKNIKVTQHLLMGYSLGGLQAAFVSYIDELRKDFSFLKVILINPPVDLYTSLQTLDKLALAKAYQVKNAEDFFNLIFKKLARFFGEEGYINIDEGLFFDIQGSEEALTREEMALLIAASFRFGVAEMSFTVDEINKYGIFIPKNVSLDVKSSLTSYFKQALLCNFSCYLSKFILPYSDSSLAEIVEENSLYQLKDYISQSKKIYAITNSDDFILSNQDVDFLKETFGERLTLYPYGGHCGNLNYQQNVDDLLEILAK